MNAAKLSAADRTLSTLILLSIIILFAAAVRFWGIDFGLPQLLCRPDESRLVNLAVKFGGGDLNPHMFNYPTLYPYVLFVLYAVYYLFGLATGKFSSVDDFVLEFAIDPSAFYLLDRVVVAVLGTATVYVVYRIALRMLDRSTALVSSVFMALAYLHVRDSHFGVTDVPMTFLIMCSCLWLIRSAQDRSVKSYLLAGLLAGLATSVKYAGLMLAIPMMAAHLSAESIKDKGWLTGLIDRRPLVFMAAMLIAFLIGTPYALLDHTQFLKDFTFEMRHLDYGHRHIILDRGWWHHLHFTLWHGLGWPLLATSIAGMIVMVRRAPRTAILFLSFPLVYYFVAGKGYAVFARYMIPVVPFLCIAAAFCVMRISGWIASRWGGRAGRVAVPLLVALTLAPSLRAVVAFNTLITEVDSRIIAAEWVRSKIPRGSSIYHGGSLGSRLQINPGQFFIDKYTQHAAMIDGGLSNQGEGSRLRRMVDSLKDRRHYDEWLLEKETSQFIRGDTVCQGLPEYIITEESPLRDYSRTDAYVQQLIETRYRLVKRFNAVDVSGPADQYDQQDLLYVPFAGFAGVERPGPNLNIYKLIADKGRVP